jgi:hypothetical protein
VAVCALGAFAAPALAAKEKPPVIFGKFKANILGKTISPSEPASTKGHGSVSAMRLGPYTFTGRKLPGEKFGPICEKELKSTGMVDSESSDTFLQYIKFNKCIAYRKLGAGVEEEVKVHFKLGIEYHSNFSAVLGEPETSEVMIKPGSTVSFKGRKSFCVVTIPQQYIPIQAQAKPEKEYEAASYSTETETLEGSKAKKYKEGIEEKLNIEMEFKKIETYIQTTPECVYNKENNGGNEGKYNKDTGRIEFDNGNLEAELEEITLKHGSIGFEPAP